MKNASSAGPQPQRLREPRGEHAPGIALERDPAPEARQERVPGVERLRLRLAPQEVVVQIGFEYAVGAEHFERASAGTDAPKARCSSTLPRSPLPAATQRSWKHLPGCELARGEHASPRAAARSRPAAWIWLSGWVACSKTMLFGARNIQCAKSRGIELSQSGTQSVARTCSSRPIAPESSRSRSRTKAGWKM